MLEKQDITQEQNGRAATTALAPSAALFHAASTTTALSPFPSPDRSKPSNASALGQWVFNHQKQFSADSPLAWYGIRNVANNMVAILGLMATIVPVRMGMGKVARWAEGKNFTKTQQFFSNAVLQNSVGVGISFATFRVMYKMGQRAYDRVFVKPKDADETSQQIRDLPKNWWQDFKQISPAEYPATIAAAFALVGIRAAFTPAGPELPQNHWKDVTACALLAYPAFFEITDRLGESFQSARGYHDKEKNEHLGKHNMSLGTFLTRQVPGIAAGIVPYIGVNNVLYRHTGRQMSYNSIQLGKGIKQIDKYWPAFWKERPYEVFWMFSLGRDLYFDAYDKLTGKTKEEKKEGIPSAERKDNPDRAEGAPVASTAVAVPTPQIGHVFHQGELAAAPAVEPSRATA